AKIMDFGLARRPCGAQLTRAGTTMGTVAYMSPEQAQGKTIDHRTDLWSLGVVLYEMVVGRRPFRGDHDQAVIYSILNDPPESASQSRPDVPAALDAVIHSLLSKHTADRCQSATQAAADLSRMTTTAGVPTSVLETGRPKAAASIAVMPFADMSPDRDQEYFCDGMSEEIINELTGVSGLRVIARTSAFAFKGKDEDIREIGRKLDVTSILEGSVRKAGERVRITAQLINVADGSHVWSERYDRVLEDVFAIQDEIAAAIVKKLRIELTDSEQDRLAEAREVGTEAHELYLRGKHVLNRGLMTLLYDRKRVDRAIEFFTRATEMDPDYAPPYAGLADVYSALCRWITPTGNCEKARRFATKAIELDSGLAEAHVAMGRVLLTTEFDWERARGEHVRSIEINPGSAAAQRGAALYYGWAGEFTQAIVHARRALDLDPLDYGTHLVVMFTMAIARTHRTEAVDFAEAAVELFPDDQFFEGSALWHRVTAGVDVEASADEFLRRWPDHEVAGLICAVTGRVDEARKVIARLEKRGDEGLQYNKARIYAALGEKETALELLEKTWDETPRIFLQLNSDPELDFLRREQRFKDLVKRSGIPLGELAHLSE
ncbi:protein kinase, partial [bacterium]|nr:protein kinase [bacterium]